MRLIDADALEVQMGNRHAQLCSQYGVHDQYTRGYGDAFEVLDFAPTVDAVVVVRCKDCKYMHTITEPSGKQHFHCRIAYGMPDVRLIDFCNHGERKTSDEE